MDSKMQLQKNAAVLSADGQRIGSLNRVVVNPNNLALTDIVIRADTRVDQEERVIPVKWVAKTAPDQVMLGIQAEDLKAFPPFEEPRVGTEKNAEHASGENPGSLPPMSGISVQPAFDEEFVTRIDQKTSQGTVAVKAGTSVMSADGKHVGTVERTVTDIPHKQATHLLVSQGRIKKRMKLIPMDWVRNVDEEAVYLLVYKTSVNDLADALVPK